MRNVSSLCSITVVLCVCSLLGSDVGAYEVENLTKLTDGPIRESGAAFNASGTRIVYTNYNAPYSWANCDIWVMNIDGSGKTQITTDSRGEFDPRFAPDGRITYTKEFGSNDYDLWIVNSDGSNPLFLVGGSYRQTLCRWHPVGNKIIYCSEYQFDGPSEIWTANSDGSGKVRLTDQNVDGYGQNSPIYSRSGNLIAYVNYPTVGSNPNIWVMNSDGSGKQQITFDATGQNPMFWWPDDSLIGYVQDGDLWLHNLSAGTDEIFLSDRSIGWADLSSDGSKMVLDLLDESGRHIWIGDVTGGEPPPALPDFSISYIKPPVQVIWNSDYNFNDVNDLVAGKSTAVLVYVGIENYEQLGEDGLVEVRLNFNNEYITLTSKTIAELQKNNNMIEFLLPDSIVKSGEKTIIAEVDPRKFIPESNEDNNSSELDAKITVWDCYSLKLIYIPVTGPQSGSGYGPLNMTDYSTTVEKADSFMHGVYPVAENKLIMMSSEEEYLGFPANYNQILNPGVVLDCLSLWAMGELITITAAQNVIGIVPEKYFKYHTNNPADPTVGLSYPNLGASVVKVGFWTAVAHEIGHVSWFLPDQYSKGEYTGDLTNGFWVTKNTEIQNGTCFMGPCPNSSYFIGDRHVWICNECYRNLFWPIWPVPILSIENVSDVLLFSGMISKDGTVTLCRSYIVENGEIDSTQPGDYAVQLLDSEGQILTNISFHTAYEAHVDPGGTMETDFAPFAFVIPYPENTSTIEILHNGQTLIEISPNSKLLHDAVDSIPDYGFIGNVDQRRKALHNKIDEFETKIENNEIRDARNKLELDIRDKFEKWLVDAYQPQNPLQLSKNEILALVDNILNRFSIIWPGMSSNTKIAESEFDSTVTEESMPDLDKEIDLAFYEWIETEEFASMPPTDSPSSNDSDNSAMQEDVATKPETTDYDEVGSRDNEEIKVQEAVAVTLFESSERINELDAKNFSNKKSATVLVNKIDDILAMMDDGLLTEAIYALEYDILESTNGCADIGQPDENDLITTCEGQGEVYPLIAEAIDLLESLIK